MAEIARLAAALAAAVLLCQCAIMPPRVTPAKLGPNDWRARDGKLMPFTAWPPEPGPSRQPVTAALICVHGLSGAASDFWVLGQELPKQKIVVYAAELRGQGNDPDERRRGDIRHAAEWRRDLLEFHDLIAERHPGVPVFWLAESMGSLIAMHAAGQRPASLRGLIVLSPPVGLRDRPSRWKYCAARLAAFIAPARRISLAAFDEERVRALRVTSDTTQHSRADITPHFLDRQSFRLLRHIEQMMHGSTRAATSLDLPILLLYTPNDPVTSRHQVEQWFACIPSSDKTALFYPRAYHLILHDTDRWEAAAQIGDWILHRQSSPRTRRLRPDRG